MGYRHGCESLQEAVCQAWKMFCVTIVVYAQAAGSHLDVANWAIALMIFKNPISLMIEMSFSASTKCHA